MFVLTQFIGLAVLHADVFHIEQEVDGKVETVSNPYLAFIEPPEVETPGQSVGMLGSLIVAFVIAIVIFFLLSRFKIEFVLRLWFFAVVVIALFLSVFAFEKLMPWGVELSTAFIAGFGIAIPLAFVKVYRQNFLVHNFTELLIYPGIAAVFVPILNVYTIIALLILISLYDMWAVWHTGIMQKMAAYQMDKLNIFGGFLVPYVGKKTKKKIKLMKQKLSRAELKKKKVRVSVAILGGGDIVFPIITAGVLMKAFENNVLFGIGGLGPALFVIAGATLALAGLFIFSEKKKFYPAMPFISAGIFAGMILSWIVSLV